MTIGFRLFSLSIQLALTSKLLGLIEYGLSWFHKILSLDNMKLRTMYRVACLNRTIISSRSTIEEMRSGG